MSFICCTYNDKLSIQKLTETVGIKNVLSVRGDNKKYLYDETAPLIRPEANKDCTIVIPGCVSEISEIVKIANSYHVNVVVRGGGTGLCAAAIPTTPSIIISMERFNRVIEVDEKNFIITVESGVTLKEMQEYLNNNNAGFCVTEYTCNEHAQVGGMVSENAGGIKSWRRGTMRNNVRGIEAVLPTGEIVVLNGKIRKNNAGYDLMQLLIGSEGTLGIITKVMLSISPNLYYKGIILSSFQNYDGATEATTKIMQAGISPHGIEYLDRTIALETCKYLHCDWPLKKGKVDLIFIMEEENEEILFNDCEIIEEICSISGCVESVVLDGQIEQEKILDIRRATYHATKPLLVDTLDITVPPACIPDFMREFISIAESYGAKINTVGHIGDGNLHNNIYTEKKKVPVYYENMKTDIYKIAISYGGTITGEHGIGKIRRENLKLQLEDKQIELMRGIKKIFDPNNILNADNAII